MHSRIKFHSQLVLINSTHKLECQMRFTLLKSFSWPFNWPFAFTINILKQGSKSLFDEMQKANVPLQGPA